jgi:3-phosphoshikimate 1-carboxyvinyltransferase
MAESIKLIPKAGPLLGTVTLPTSKSICNRLLVLSKLAGQDFPEDQLSSADDSRLIFDALNFNERTINVGNAGTAYRFLTAFSPFKMDEKRFCLEVKQCSKGP